MEETILELKNLKKYYKKQRGIESISFQIKKGDIYGFIGPNGAGKSTTIRTIMGLLNKTSGNIYMNNKELDIENIETKRKIGYLPSEINLYEDMTIKQLLDYHESFYKIKNNKRRKDLVNLFKIEENKKIEDLSLGNLKKLGIVLAFLHEPELLILDEPTSGLDPIMQNNFHNLLLQEKEKGTTVLYSSHVLSEVSNICNRIGFIKDGLLIKEDSMDNIKKELKLEVINENNQEITLLNNMQPNDLINKLSKYNIQKLIIEEIPLEDLFMKYYK